MYFNVKEQRLSDGSTVFNVEGRDKGEVITIGATNKRAANRIADLLNNDDVVAWVQIGEERDSH